MEIIDLAMDEVIDLSGEEEAMQDINPLQHHHLNGYISDDGFVVAPSEEESDAEEDDESDMEDRIHHLQLLQHHHQQQQPQAQVHSECSICLENVTGADEGGNVTILPCGHIFHNVCMNGWLLDKLEGECPTCKGTIEGAQNI